MAGKGRRPTEGKKFSKTWDVIECEAGQRVQGYVAGPHIRVRCHREAYPKVCLKEHAGSEDCPGCVAHKDTTWYAWLPVYREPDKHEIMCAFLEPQWDVLDALTHLQPVVIGREWPTGKLKGFKCPLWINPSKTKDVYAPSDKLRQRERCIGQALIYLWKYFDRITVDQLLAEDTPKLDPTAVEVPNGTKPKLGRPVMTDGKRTVQHADSVPITKASELFDEVIHRRTGHLDKPSRNGTH